MKSFKLYMLFPFLLLFAAFAFDKIFFIGKIPYYFMGSASYLNYDHKLELLDELDQYLKEKNRSKTLVIMGNSRSMSFERKYIETKFPGWTIFNFSVPGGTPDYYAFLMEKFQERNLKPDSIMFFVSPDGFNKNPKIVMGEVMLNGLSFSFIARNFHRFHVDDLTNYIAKKTIWTYRYRPRINSVRERLKNNSQAVKDFEKFLALTRSTMVKERGSVPYGYDHKNPDPGDMKKAKEHEEVMLETANSGFYNFLYPFEWKQGQLDFMEDCLRTAGDMGIQAFLIKPRVGPILRKYLDEKPSSSVKNAPSVNAIWNPVMKNIAKKYNVPLVDFNDDQIFNCDHFYDSSHLSGYCFPEFTKVLIGLTAR